jgi:hypothetical protein
VVSVRSSYVRAMRAIRGLLSRVGALEPMERSDRLWVRHLRTMLAIYDTEDLARLDLPWWTYSAIEEVEKFLHSREARVFEYGSGASTLWLARRSDHVFSAEHDPAFAALVEKLDPTIQNVTFITVTPSPTNEPGAARSQRPGYEGMDFSSYTGSIERVGGDFDLIVIDGRARVACLDRAVEHLKPDGLILFDDIRRKRYRSALDRQGFDVEVFTGTKPSIPYRDATALMRPSGA